MIKKLSKFNSVLMLLTLTIFYSNSTYADQEFIGPVPYLSETDSPFFNLEFEYFYLEDFEALEINPFRTPGLEVSYTGHIGCCNAFADSVDGDDGTIDGSGAAGASLYVNDGSVGAKFNFDEQVLGNYPTHAGIVWTDGGGGPRSVSLEVFNAAGESSGIFGPHVIGDNTTRSSTAEDRFLGVFNPDGISSIRIYQNGSDMEVDHLQYGRSSDCTQVECPSLTISTQAIGALQLNTFSSQQLETRRGEPPFVWSVVDGALPPGMNLSADGVFSGTPTELGESTFTVKVTDNNGDSAEREFTIEVVLVLPPPDIRIEKTGTVTVPGRVIDYFAVVENMSDVTATDILVTEFLEPWFTFVDASPAPSAIEQGPDYFPMPEEGSEVPRFDSLLDWVIPELEPGESTLITYRVLLDPTLPFGSPVTGKMCWLHDPQPPGSCRDEYEKCLIGFGTGCALAGPGYAECVAVGWGACLLSYLACLGTPEAQPPFP